MSQLIWVPGLALFKKKKKHDSNSLLEDKKSLKNKLNYNPNYISRLYWLGKWEICLQVLIEKCVQMDDYKK